MSKLFEDLKTGLEQAIEYERGNGEAKVTTYVIMPVKKYTSSDVKSVRNKAGMTQTVFADYLGVSKKTVEAWERGRSAPAGPACRLIEMLENNKDENPFIQIG